MTIVRSRRAVPHTVRGRPAPGVYVDFTYALSDSRSPLHTHARTRAPPAQIDEELTATFNLGDDGTPDDEANEEGGLERRGGYKHYKPVYPVKPLPPPPANCCYWKGTRVYDPL